MVDRQEEDLAAPAIDAEASTLMKRGLQLLEAADASRLAEALVCFDGALELRRRLPIDAVPAYRYGLAACWLNRADALVRLGGSGSPAEAIHSYDAAIEVARGLPLQDDPRFPRRLAIAHQNRGLALLAYGRPVAEAIAAFTEAVAILEHEHAARIPDRPYALAAVWVNLANAYASEPAAAPAALAAAQRAIDLVAGLEGENPDAADVGLKARHVLCRAVAPRLAAAFGADAVSADDVHAATDAVDDGLQLVQRWERAGVTRFRGLAYDLFRFGARVYAAYQPQFLDEFVRDQMAGDDSLAGYVGSPEMQSAAREALALATRTDG